MVTEISPWALIAPRAASSGACIRRLLCDVSWNSRDWRWPWKRLQGRAGPDDYGVPGVRTLHDRAQSEAVRLLGREVLQGVHGKVGFAADDDRFDLAHEEAFSPDLGEGAVTSRPSKAGNWVSVTVTIEASSR